MIDIAEELIFSSGEDDLDPGRLADLIWDEYGAIDRPEELSSDEIHILLIRASL